MANPLVPPQLEMVIPAEEEHPRGLQADADSVLNQRAASPMNNFNQG